MTTEQQAPALQPEQNENPCFDADCDEEQRYECNKANACLKNNPKKTKQPEQKEPEYRITEKQLETIENKSTNEYGECSIPDEISDAIRSRPLTSAPLTQDIKEALTEEYRQGFDDGRIVGEADATEKVLIQIVDAMKSGQQCPHTHCINDQMSCVDCWWQWIESLRKKNGENP